METNIRTMKQLLFLLPFLIFSCGGTRKVEKTENIDKHYNLNFSNEYSVDNSTEISNSFTYTPADITKPMVFGGKSYQNVILSTKNKKTTSSKVYVKTAFNIVKTIVITKTKIVEKTDYSILWICLGSVALILIFLWLYLPKLP